MVGEFIRILGLTPVAIGRGEVELMTVGNTFLRRFLTDLLTIEVNPRIPGGMLHLSRVLDPTRMAVLAAVPLPQLTAESAIESNLALARTFMPRAKTLCASLGVEWPPPSKPQPAPTCSGPCPRTASTGNRRRRIVAASPSGTPP